ncbi:MAG: aminotransferase class V-fold PLP-dependent enzyme [Herpetosiphon sp.]
MQNLEHYFAPYREQIIGQHHAAPGPYGPQRIVYADWTASGRLYGPIERRMQDTFAPCVGNTHSESSFTGATTTEAYHLAHDIIKQHVHALPSDILITAGSGMTGVVNKFQRILGLRVPEQLAPYCTIPDHLRPVVFVTHMEHHSNHTSWLETIADVECIPPAENGLVDVEQLHLLLQSYRDRPLKLGSFTACSNVTGIETPYHQLATVMHEYGGYCFVDFAASAPYVAIDMHPPDPRARLDAIFFSPHKFLGGPGTSGVLLFDGSLYHNQVPDDPGGGTVNWTNPWHQHSFVTNIEAREDGGTPGFMQAIKTALAIKLKEAMTSERIRQREHELVQYLMREVGTIPGLHILAGDITQRLGIISFYVDGLHYNLLVKLLSDRFGIQMRGGCSCAGTYGHYLLHVDRCQSNAISQAIDHGDLSHKPGWVRCSIHPTTTDAEAAFIADAIRETVRHHDLWQQDYRYLPCSNEWKHRSWDDQHLHSVRDWFTL